MAVEPQYRLWVAKRILRKKNHAGGIAIPDVQVNGTKSKTQT